MAKSEDAAVESIARAMCEADGLYPDGCSGMQWQKYEGEARRFVAAARALRSRDWKGDDE